jgi:hypothetical protein
LRHDLGFVGCGSQNGILEIIGRFSSQQPIDIRKMAAIELVKIAVVRRTVFRAVPPVPIAAFGDKQFFIRKSPRLDISRFGVSRVKIAGFGEIVPREVVLGCADPYIKVRVDPGSGHEGVELSDVPRAGNGFGNRDRLDLRIGLNSVIETAQELSSRVGKVFPGILAVENHRDGRVVPGFQQRRG